MTTGDGRTLRRLLRFLARGPATVRGAAVEGTALLDGGDRGCISVRTADLRGGVGEGLVAIADGVATLTGKDRDPDNTRAIVVVPVHGEAVAVNENESPLSALRRRTGRDGTRFLTEREFRAGERLRADYTRGQIIPRLGINWGAAGGGGRKQGDANGIAELTEAALAARQRVERAVEAVGPELAGILIDVCCFLKGLERVELERRWPARSAKVVLKSALAALARHYEPVRGNMPGRAGAILHWGAQDYRPRL